MRADQILEVLWAQGFTVALGEGGGLVVAPASKLHDTQRQLLLAHKPQIVALLQDAHATTEKLLAAAMRCCDQHGDGDEARQQMRDDCLALPPHLKADLLNHFQRGGDHE